MPKKVTYLLGDTESLRKAIKENEYVKNFSRQTLIEHKDKVTINSVKITSGINKKSGKRFYSFKKIASVSCKIIEYKGAKYLNCYIIRFNGRKRSIEECRPDLLSPRASKAIYDMCSELIGPHPKGLDMYQALAWYWKPLVYKSPFSVSNYKELRGISPRTSTMSDVVVKLTGKFYQGICDYLTETDHLESSIIYLINMKNILDNVGEKTLTYLLEDLPKVGLSAVNKIVKGFSYIPNNLISQYVDGFLDSTIISSDIMNIGRLNPTFTELFDFTLSGGHINLASLGDILRFQTYYNQNFPLNNLKKLEYLSEYGINVPKNIYDILDYLYIYEIEMDGTECLFFYYKDEDEFLVKTDTNLFVMEVFNFDKKVLDVSELTMLLDLTRA